MPLTIDELDALELGAYLCDGEPFDYFERNMLPGLATMQEGELWALSGMFLDRCMPGIARFIAAYARVVRHGVVDEQPRPEPRQFLADWDAEQEELRATPMPETFEEAQIPDSIDKALAERMAKHRATVNRDPSRD